MGISKNAAGKIISRPTAGDAEGWMVDLADTAVAGTAIGAAAVAGASVAEGLLGNREPEIGQRTRESSARTDKAVLAELDRREARGERLGASEQKMRRDLRAELERKQP